MTSLTFEDLRPFQGKVVRLTSTEAEVMLARVLLVDKEHQNVIVEVFSTDQPKRYERWGRGHSEAGWAIPFEFIASVSEGDDSDLGSR